MLNCIGAAPFLFVIMSSLVGDSQEEIIKTRGIIERKTFLIISNFSNYILIYDIYEIYNEGTQMTAR